MKTDLMSPGSAMLLGSGSVDRRSSIKGKSLPAMAMLVLTGVLVLLMAARAASDPCRVVIEKATDGWAGVYMRPVKQTQPTPKNVRKGLGAVRMGLEKR